MALAAAKAKQEKVNKLESSIGRKRKALLPLANDIGKQKFKKIDGR